MRRDGRRRLAGLAAVVGCGLLAALLYLHGRSGPDRGEGGPVGATSNVERPRLRGAADPEAPASIFDSEGPVEGVVYSSGPPPGTRLTDASPPPPFGVTDESCAPESGTLRVLVTDDAGGFVEGVSLSVSRLLGGGATEEIHSGVAVAGRAEVREIPPGKAVALLRRNRRMRSLVVPIEAGRITELVALWREGSAITGQVRRLDGEPLSAVRVVLRRRDGFFEERLRARTDDEGRYEIADVPPGAYGVGLLGGPVGFDPRSRAELVVCDDPLVRDFILGRVAYSGTVIDAETGRPLADARITAWVPKPYWVRLATDAAGHFELEDLPPGDYVLHATLDGYVRPRGHEFTVGEGEAGTCELALHRAAVLSVQALDDRGRSLAGRFQLAYRDKDDLHSSGSGLVTLDAGGRGTFTQIPVGRHDVSLGANGYETAFLQVEVSDGTADAVFVLRAVDEAASGPESLRGSIRGAASGSPIPGARVVLQRLEPQAYHVAQSDPDGRWRMRGVTAGTYDVVVSKDGHGLLRLRDVQVPASAPLELDLELRDAALLRIGLTGPDGTPVQGEFRLLAAPVEGSDGTGVQTRLRADAEGRATYHRLVPGIYRLVLRREGAPAYSTRFVLREGENTLHVRFE